MRLPRPNTKAARVLAALMTGKSYNLFEAESELHDRSLHSTVSTLQNNYDIRICRNYESVAGFEGSKTKCCRYWIDAKERLRIKRRLFGAKKKDSVSLKVDRDDHTGEKTSPLNIAIGHVKNGLKTLARF
jgi:hypothetical protein